jgi:hypothetical protein
VKTAASALDGTRIVLLGDESGEPDGETLLLGEGSTQEGVGDLLCGVELLVGVLVGVPVMLLLSDGLAKVFEGVRELLADFDGDRVWLNESVGERLAEGHKPNGLIAALEPNVHIGTMSSPRELQVGPPGHWLLISHPLRVTKSSAPPTKIPIRLPLESNTGEPELPP